MAESLNDWDYEVRAIWSTLPCDFPPEIWQEIFNGIKDMALLNTIYNVGNLGWCELLRPRRAQFMFLKALPHLLNHLEGRDLWKIRSVCNVWREGIDFLLENGPRYRHGPRAPAGNELVPLVNVPRDHQIFRQASITFKTGAEIINFLIRMRAFVTPQDNNYNPIAGRSVCFNPETTQVHVADLVRFEQHMRLFLAILGDHIWHFYYKMPLYESPIHAINMMVNILRSMPNLKTLHLEEGLHWFSRGIVSEQQLLGVEEQGREEHLPFPHMENLVEISLPNYSLFHRHLLADITTHYRPIIANIRYLHIQHQTYAIINIPLNGPSTIQIRDQIRENARVEVAPQAGRHRALLPVLNEDENDDQAEEHMEVQYDRSLGAYQRDN